MRLAEAAGKGAFVLAATSNPEAAAIQQAVVAEESPQRARPSPVRSSKT